MRSSRFRRRQTLLAWFAIVLLVALQLQLVPQFNITDTTTAHASSYDTLPLAFEPNHGQAGDGVQYVVHHGQSITAFTKDGATTSIGTGAVTMSLVGAAPQSYVGQNELESKTNYFIGNDPSKWQSNIPNYQSLFANDVYPGIDLTYYGTNSKLEHDFIVSPGVDYTQIAFTLAGQDNIHLDDNGNLILEVGEDTLTLQAPKTYQERPGSIHTIPSSFVLDGSAVHFELYGDWDPTLPLVIDPVLIYSTYLGGTGSEEAYNVFVDPSGNAYAAGITTSTNFPTSSPYQAASGGGTDIFVTKLNPAGSALVYSTYLGGSGTEANGRVAVDISGNAYITGGTTSTNFPTASAYQGSMAGVEDAFVTKLNPTGSALVYSTYLGGTALDRGGAIQVDSSGSAYVAGNARSTNFPTSSPFQAANAGGVEGDAFLTKFNAAGSALVYSTFLGGTGSEVLNASALYSDGSVILSGYTESTNFPTSSPFQAAHGGGTRDVFLAKFNSAGSALDFATYLGGSGDDRGGEVAFDTSGNVYNTGLAVSTNFPTSSPYQAANAGGQDAYVAKFNSTGSTLVYSTYLGGSGNDRGAGIDVDSSGNAYTTGFTNSTNFPVVDAYQSTSGGGQDGYVTKFNSAGSALTYSTYIGGSGTELPFSLILDLSNTVYIAGLTSSTDFPTFAPFQAANAGGAQDAFVTKLSHHSVVLSAQVNPTLTFDLSANSCALGTLSVSQAQFCTYTITAATNGTNGYTISYLPAATLTSAASDTISHLSSQTASVLGAEQFGFNLRANTAAASFTAVDFGADPSGGVGTVATAYNTANQFKFNTSGETVATTTGPSVNTIFTVGTIANVASNTEAGAYTTTLTYNIVSGY